MMLEFSKINIDRKKDIDKYYYKFGEGSCQHSFVSNYCFKDKYDDYYCEMDSTLYVLRNGLCDSQYRTYLFPMLDLNDETKLRKAIDNIMTDAKSHNKKVLFNSITDKAKEKIKIIGGDRFNISENRELYEYIYNVDDLAHLLGPKYYNKRNEVKSFFKKYDNHLLIKEIEKDDLNNIKELGRFWIDQDANRIINKQLIIENRALDIILNNYDELRIIGIVVYVDNNIAGFIVGSALNEEMVDAIIEKGNIKYKGIYRVLNNEFAKLCLEKYKYINLEEDLGVEGLRNMKLLYHPTTYIKKYIAAEV
ncbi:MAG: DUF2156 domain-containing protein [Lachnospiraceae bacterium]|nr:DUF2156 domain-containing protein [Lachnospiraceae bacterium]